MKLNDKSILGIINNLLVSYTQDNLEYKKSLNEKNKTPEYENKVLSNLNTRAESLAIAVAHYLKLREGDK